MSMKDRKKDMTVNELAAMMMGGFERMEKKIEKIDGKIDIGLANLRQEMNSEFMDARLEMRQGFEHVNQRIDNLENAYSNNLAS